MKDIMKDITNVLQNLLGYFFLMIGTHILVLLDQYN
jgi:hypothetical protein